VAALVFFPVKVFEAVTVAPGNGVLRAFTIPRTMKTALACADSGAASVEGDG